MIQFIVYLDRRAEKTSDSPLFAVISVDFSLACEMERYIW